MLLKRFLIRWTDAETKKIRKASVRALTEEHAFLKLLKDERYEESLYVTFGKNIDLIGHKCVEIRHCNLDPALKPDRRAKVIYF